MFFRKFKDIKLEIFLKVARILLLKHYLFKNNSLNNVQVLSAQLERNSRTFKGWAYFLKIQGLSRVFMQGP
jgi:hypothetical protein